MRPIHRRMACVVLFSVVACGTAPSVSTPASTSPAAPSSSPAAIPTAAATDPIQTIEPSASPGLGAWRPAASMIRARTGFDAVRLGDGTVLAVGDDFACHPGGAAPGSERAERYDPIKDSWAEVGSLNKPRKLPATVVLADGKAMVLGGINSDDVSFSSTKIFDPGEGAWTNGPLLEFARGTPLAASLPGGRVFVADTVGDATNPRTSELYDPGSATWSPRAAPPANTDLDTGIALSDGRVLAIGLDFSGSDPVPVSVLYDPDRDAWTAVADLDQFGFELVALADGSALAVGGIDGQELLGGDGSVTSRVSRLEPKTNRWTRVAPMATARIDAQLVLLDDGRVLVGGGATRDTNDSAGRALRSTEVYDPASDAWSPAADLLAPRYDGHAIALDDGTVLVLGGSDAFNVEGDVPYCAPPLTTAERFDPAA